ncbi:hypothetical protein [Mycobacterium sp.]|uniref:hypothetical protein n=1 Tax=Mycobacterium sp. TaxID=1785 RepID=UPI003F94CE08
MTGGVEAMARGVEVDRLECRLPDGGRVEVTDRAVVPMGDVKAYRQLTYTHGGGKGRPACRIIFEVQGGVPVCASFTLSAVGQTPVRAKDLRAIKLDELRETVYATAGVFMPTSDGKWLLTVGYSVEDRQHVEQAARRRKVTPELLSQVAEIHNQAPDDGHLEAVVSAFRVSERQAWRYIAQARKEGLIR